MAVVLRLQRTGKKQQPQYKIVAVEKKSAPGAKAKEVLGTYNPCNPKAGDQIKLNKERYDYWVKTGALASPTVAALAKKAAAN